MRRSGWRRFSWRPERCRRRPSLGLICVGVLERRLREVSVSHHLPVVLTNNVNDRFALILSRRSSCSRAFHRRWNRES